ncbi:major facilitator superfamily domain-containing protein [Xylogone sp. PMI_703]|nr:major facilitator superfamily domain-containing protein [Xylogone sp. PMI_703]
MSDPEKNAITVIGASTTDSSSDEERSAGAEINEDEKAKIQRRLEALRPSDPPPIALMTLFRSKEKHDLNAIATQPSVFDNPDIARYFQPSAKYENLHRFDPDERWTWAEELPLIKKIDWKVTAWACIAFFALCLDRSNLSQANTDNFLDDLGLSTNVEDYNLGNTVFTSVFLVSELPSQLVSKKLGPDRWIPAQMILWSIVAASQFWLSGKKSFLATRALLGVLQGGFIPDVCLYLSYFFKGTELPFRLAMFWMANRMTDVVAPLLAYGILHLRGHRGIEGWRWLFLIEGVFTLVIGIWSIFMMTPSPTQTKAWWRPKGWFTEREEKILVNRILRDDPSKGDMHNRQAITPKLLWESLSDYDLWPIYIIGMLFGIPGNPPDTYLTLTLRSLGFDTFNSNLLSIPAQIATTINMLILTYLSETYIKQRAYLGLVAQIWFLPCLIALSVLPTGTNKWGSYALVTVLLSYPTPHPMQVGWTSRNSNTVRTRTVSAAAYNMMVQLSSIISANIYRADDKPLYRRGNRVLVAITCLNIVVYLSTKAYYVFRNKQRDRIWDAMSDEEKERYRATTTDKGSKRLDFRFVS